METKIQTAIEEDDVLSKLTTADLEAATKMTANEARFVIDTYLQWQDNRIRADGQVRSMRAGDEPHRVLDFLSVRSFNVECQIKRALAAYAKVSPLGEWALSITGIGPVLAAGLLAYIDITQAPTVGHIWSFAGLNPTAKWAKGKKRPWCAALKVICWKIGESFIKQSSRESCFYGKIFRERKALEIQKNEAGDFREQAAAGAERVDGKTQAWGWYSGCYSAGDLSMFVALKDAKAREQFLKEKRREPGTGVPMLPPDHINSRARRYAVKLFLAHFHEQAYRLHYKTDPPKPYAIEHAGHAHFIPAAKAS